MSRLEGEMIQVQDQTSEHMVVQSLLRNKAEQVPVILIVGRCLLSLFFERT